MKEDFLLVIPARLESTRLPKKLLIDIEGKSIIERTYKQALKSIKDKEKIIIATDSLEIKDHCEKFGSRTLLTSKKCLTGTDRIAEVSEKIFAEQYINLQGDEPLFPSDQLKIFIKNVTQDKSKVYTAVTSIKDEKDLMDDKSGKGEDCSVNKRTLLHIWRECVGTWYRETRQTGKILERELASATAPFIGPEESRRGISKTRGIEEIKRIKVVYIQKSLTYTRQGF